MTSLPEQPPRPRLRGNVHYIETQFATRIRLAVITLAKREARETVKRQLRAEGRVKVWLLSASEINTLADAHLRAHAEELLAQAEASQIVRNLRYRAKSHA
jgi:hypothetical protein